MGADLHVLEIGCRRFRCFSAAKSRKSDRLKLLRFQRFRLQHSH